MDFGKSWIWNQYLPKDMKWKILKSWIWDQHLQENMRWNLELNMGSISFKKHEMEVWEFPIDELKQLEDMLIFNETNLNIEFSFQLRASPHPSTFRLLPMHWPPSWGTQVRHPAKFALAFCYIVFHFLHVRDLLAFFS